MNSTKRFSVVPIHDYDRAAYRRKSLVHVSLNEIMAANYPPIRWIVREYVPEGFSVLAGRQKLGKTWMALDWALAVATGGVAMGSIPVEQGDVLYIDLENGHRRMQGGCVAFIKAPQACPIWLISNL